MLTVLVCYLLRLCCLVHNPYAIASAEHTFPPPFRATHTQTHTPFHPHPPHHLPLITHPSPPPACSALSSACALSLRSKWPPDWNRGGYAMSTFSGLSLMSILGGLRITSSVNSGGRRKGEVYVRVRGWQGACWTYWRNASKPLRLQSWEGSGSPPQSTLMGVCDIGKGCVCEVCVCVSEGTYWTLCMQANPSADRCTKVQPPDLSSHLTPPAPLPEPTPPKEATHSTYRSAWRV